MEISKFKNVFNNENGELTSISEFINNVKFGHWQSEISEIRQEKDKERRSKLKQKIPYVTISGTFNERKKDSLLEHSGFICLDFDEIEDLEKAFHDISSDPYVYSAFKSVSGLGIAALVKIDPKKHLDAFLGLEAYFANKYHLTIDRACKDVSRARLVSYDSKATINEKAAKFVKYLPKVEQKKVQKMSRVITGKNDIDFILEGISAGNINLSGDEYAKHLNIGFALAEELGESGRDVFHAVSQQSTKYDATDCDRQFNKCLKGGGSGVGFATFLFYCKEAGVSIISPETKQVIAAASIGKKAGRGIVEQSRTIQAVNPEIDPAIVKEITEKVFARETVDPENLLPRQERIELFLNTEYDLKRNEITRFIEIDGKQLDGNIINSITIKAIKEVDEKINNIEIERTISSDFTPDFNPLKDYFENNSHIKPNGKVNQLIDSINSNTGIESEGAFFPQYKDIFVRKWLVGIIASIYGEHSPQLLVLTGGQGTGKTEFFRNLLPEEFKIYFAQSKLDAGKDDEILMTQKILILDDEFGGKSKSEAKKLKELTSKDFFTLREPYGKCSVRLKRLSVLCGTSNDEALLSDPTGNRRIIPLDVQEIYFDKLNAINRKELFLELYHLYKSGFEWRLTKEDIEHLNENTHEFEQVRAENELIKVFYKPGHLKKKHEEIIFVMATEIKSYIERITGQKLLSYKLQPELKALGFKQVEKEKDGQVRKCFPVVKLEYDKEIHEKFSDRNNFEE